MKFRGFMLFHWILLALFLMSLVHRGLTMDLLHRQDDWKWFDYFGPFFIGAFSDFWVATIGAAAAFLTYSIFSALPKLAMTLGLLLWFWIPLLAKFLHHGYVNFFRVQIMPHHLAYILDDEFREANQGAGLDWRAVVFLLIGIGVFFVTRRIAKSIPKLNFIRQLVVIAAVICFGLTLHALNIRWRVNYMVPENLQTHMFEKLYLNMKISSISNPKPLTSEEKNYLALKLQQESPFSVPSEFTGSNGADAGGRLALVRTKFQELTRSNKVPIVLTVVLESARPGEFGIYAGSSMMPDLTPEFTELMKRGIWFSRAYSTGTVTRAGQEAVFCGLPSAVGASLMRERQDLEIDCLPRKLADVAETFWFHGGNGAFDGQAAFWRRQGVNHLITQSSFSEDAPKTGWGISDRELFKRTIPELKKLRSATQQHALLGMILTITNHIPWDLPPDAPARIRSMRVKHKSFATTAYTDWAIGEWVRELKEARLWDDLIIVFASDHGARHELYHPLYPHLEEENALSHGILAFSGGLVESVTQGNGFVSDHLVSQMDIAAWVGSLFDRSVSPTAYSNLDLPRPFPLGVDLENRIFFPNLNFVAKKFDVFSKQGLVLEDEQKFAVLYYRAMMNWFGSQFVTRK